MRAKRYEKLDSALDADPANSRRNQGWFNNLPVSMTFSVFSRPDRRPGIRRDNSRIK